MMKAPRVPIACRWASGLKAYRAGKTAFPPPVIEAKMNVGTKCYQGSSESAVEAVEDRGQVENLRV
jgi:hypothetical protein